MINFYLILIGFIIMFIAGFLIGKFYGESYIEVEENK